MFRMATPPLPLRLLSTHDFHTHAKKQLRPEVYGYYASGAGDEITLVENDFAFRRILLLPRVLRAVSKVDTTACLLGSRTSLPFSIAPCAFHKLAHLDGEQATARASSAAGICMVVSTMATTPVNEIAASGGNKGLFWFQLYVFRDRDVTKQLVRYAEEAGCKVIVVTVDRPVLGKREIDVRSGFEIPAHLGIPNVANAIRAVKGASGVAAGGSIYAGAEMCADVTWDTIKWLRSITALPVVLKGVMAAEDAVLASEAGIDAVWVSNHGARQLDSIPAPITVLPSIVKAVRARERTSGCRSMQIYVDGGVRRGSDVFKCLALGADHVFVARPILWGLAHSGEAGVSAVISILRDEFVNTMQLCGVVKLAEITDAFIAPAFPLPAKLDARL
jgi:isopentenyl diphosphate isomerase/L-lactate dehydrogenase-like FMN-dependent dehydrogenase